VRNPQAPGPRSRSALCSRRRRYDARIPPIFADHLRSSVLCIQCRQARGGIPLVAISVRACMPGQRIFTSRMGYWYTFFYFDLTEGSQGTSPFDLGHLRQTRFGHARSERRRPQFTAHNSVRPFENGLRSLGSSATRPRCWATEMIVSVLEAGFLWRVRVLQGPATRHGTITSVCPWCR
jgi:hypothetical protein